MDTLSFRTNSAIIPLICLFIYAAVIPMHLSNYVLCIGEDGHVEFEFAKHRCCKDDATLHHRHAEACPTVDDHHTGECIDFPIFASLNSCLYLVTGGEKMTAPTDVSSIPLMMQKISVPMDISASSFSVIPPLIDPVLISLRTVTLLI